MPIWLLYFFAGAGAIAFAAIATAFYSYTRKDREEHANQVRIENLRRTVRALERLCDINKVSSDKQMDALMELGKNLKLVNSEMRRLWESLTMIADKAKGKETGPDG